VPFAESKNLTVKLAEVGGEHEFITVPGAGHGLKGGKPGEVNHAADRALRFVQSHTN
jgi:hypothetical protein